MNNPIVSNPQFSHQEGPGETLTPLSRDLLQLGELGNRWTFPSDHIPVAAEVGGVRLGTWNVLNSKWVEFFAQNSEGLAASSIMMDHVPIGPGLALTKRDGHTISIALTLIEKLDLLLLQECGNEFLRELIVRLPERFQILRGRLHTSENDIVALFDTERLALDQITSDFNEDGYACKAEKPIMNMLFRGSDEEALRVIHTHVPGDPRNPGIHELASYAARSKDPNFPTVVAGDLNFLREQVLGAFSKVGLTELLNLVSFNTSVGAGMFAKDIDHILVFNPAGPCRFISAAELSPEVAEAFAILNPLKGVAKTGEQLSPSDALAME